MIVISDATDETQYGRKAANFAATAGAGLPVPLAIAFSADFLDALAYGGIGPRYLLTWICNRVKVPMAVRSSAFDDFLELSGMGGHHPDRLNIRSNSRLIQAMKDIWHEAHSGLVTYLRRQMGFPEAPRVGVILQEMVLPDVAGILYTKNPESGEDEYLIRACWGHQEAVVSGMVEPDRFRVAKDGKLVDAVLGKKEIAIDFSDAGIVQKDLSEEISGSLCLAQEQIQRLKDIGSQCEKTFGAPQTLEWAFVGYRLYILQRNPLVQGC